MYEKIVIITRKTRMEELVERFNTRSQAKFYIEHSGGDFSDYESEHETYVRSLDALLNQLNLGLKIQTIDRSFLPTILFTEKDVIVAVGQDGLVANAAKYIGDQPILGVNPDPARWDGILVTMGVEAVRSSVEQLLVGKASMKEVTLAEVALDDGQRLLAFNDLFIGARTHVSARYRLEYHHQSESQSSSGLIVSTGAGSTGWLSSVFNLVNGIGEFVGGHHGSSVHLAGQDADEHHGTGHHWTEHHESEQHGGEHHGTEHHESERHGGEHHGDVIQEPEYQGRRNPESGIAMSWDSDRLFFVVREPFVSKHSSADIVAGFIDNGERLTIESQMTTEGTIFSDGIESDFLAFNAGAIAHVSPAAQKAKLVSPAPLMKVRHDHSSFAVKAR